MHHTSRDDRASSIEPDGCSKKDDGHASMVDAPGACLASAAAAKADAAAT